MSKVLVDDERATREGLAEWLDSSGFTTATAGDAVAWDKHGACVGRRAAHRRGAK